MLDVGVVIGAVASRRPVFHSEADFQHGFAWELHLMFPEAFIRLEYPVETKLGLLHVDVVAQLDGSLHLFELKYKTRATATRVGSEVFLLQDHGAQPLGRYDFLKDLQRLEAVGKEIPGATGCAILLTNDSAYWSEPRGIDDTSAAFNLCHGRELSGRLDWSARASAGTKRGREQPLDLNYQYRLGWRDYSQIDAKRYPQFRCLAVKVVAPAAV